ncbi:hypothetical protein MNBD_GAMMA16-878 [hydrothermal vent metagenome]|uniref:DUF4123 domain-containing protein n=1 Tax=hydrothermal vent metagenome TaxID=652676 RepID=A0A3B0ZS95_9ZZZZ
MIYFYAICKTNIRLKPMRILPGNCFSRGGGKLGCFFNHLYCQYIWQTVRHNCRKLNFVLWSSGQKMLFHYYDSRVLRTYLSTCTLETKDGDTQDKYAIICKHHLTSVLAMFDSLLFLVGVPIPVITNGSVSNSRCDL